MAPVQSSLPSHVISPALPPKPAITLRKIGLGSHPVVVEVAPNCAQKINLH